MSANLDTATSATPDAVVSAAGSDLSPAADNAADESVDLAASDDQGDQTTDDLSLSDEAPETEETELEASAEGDTEVLDDPLADFDTQPLTREQIDQLFPRVSKDARALIERSETARAAYLAERAELGGEQGVELFKVIAPQLSNPDPTAKETDAIFENLTDWNPVLVARMGQNLIESALNHEQTAIPMADDLLQGEFGQGYTLEQVTKLVNWHKGGLFNEQAFEEAHKAIEGQKSPREVELEKQNQQLMERLDKVDKTVETGANAQQERLQQEAIKMVVDTVTSRIPAHAAKIGLAVKETDPPDIKAAKIRLDAVIRKDLSAKSMDWPERRRIDQMIKEGRAIGADGKPTKMFQANLDSMGPKGYAEYIAITRDLQVLLRDASRLRTTAKKETTSEAKATENGERQPASTISRPSSTPFNFDDPKYQFNPERVDSEWQKVNAARQDATTRVGRR